MARCGTTFISQNNWPDARLGLGIACWNNPGFSQKGMLKGNRFLNGGPAGPASCGITGTVVSAIFGAGYEENFDSCQNCPDWCFVLPGESVMRIGIRTLVTENPKTAITRRWIAPLVACCFSLVRCKFGCRC